MLVTDAAASLAYIAIAPICPEVVVLGDRGRPAMERHGAAAEADLTDLVVAGDVRRVDAVGEDSMSGKVRRQRHGSRTCR